MRYLEVYYKLRQWVMDENGDLSSQSAKKLIVMLGVLLPTDAAKQRELNLLLEAMDNDKSSVP